MIIFADKKADKRIHSAALDMEYTAIGGDPAFTGVAADLLFSGNAQSVVKGDRVSIHPSTINLTLRMRPCKLCLVQARFVLLANFLTNSCLERWFEQANKQKIFLPNPTWANHHPIFVDSHLEKENYRYYDAATCGLDFTGMAEDISNAPKGRLLSNADRIHHSTSRMCSQPHRSRPEP